MDKQTELKTKLNDFINHFELNTTELNNLSTKKEIYKDKMLDLLVQNVCKTRKIGNKQLENEEFICFKSRFYDKIVDKINDFVEKNSETEIKNVLKTLKDNLKKF